MIAQRVVITGRVQGVGFREGLVATAQSHKVAGWVRNRLDGSVEALLQGETHAVERTIAWCRHGPRAARVTGVDVSAVEVDRALSEFDRRPTG